MKHVIVAIATLAATALPASAMPIGSYLKQPVATRSALVNQVSKDASIRKRYTEHWVVNEDTVAARMQALSWSRLVNPITARVYYWRDVKGFHIERLGTGTKVFTTKSGKPVLLQVCGNPVEALDSPALSPTNEIDRAHPGSLDTPMTQSIEEITSGQLPGLIPPDLSASSLEMSTVESNLNAPQFASSISTQVSTSEYVGLLPLAVGAGTATGSVIREFFSGPIKPSHIVVSASDMSSGALAILGLMLGGIFLWKQK